MGLLSGLFGGLFGGKETEVKISEAERAETELLAAMRDGWNSTGLPAQRERVAQTLGMRWNESTGQYAHDPQARDASFDANGNIRQKAVNDAAAIANVSSQYEGQRPTFNPNQNARSSLMGDISQAKDEAGAQAQTGMAGVSNALIQAGNAAGLAHGSQMQSAQDMGQLSNIQATQANANAANAFGRQTRNRNAIAGLAGVATGAYQYGKQPAQKPIDYNDVANR